MKIVGVFDSTYSNDSLTTYDDGVEFLHGIERLLEEHSDIYVVWKEKKSRRDFVRRESRKLADLYGQLSRHPRCYFPGFEASPSEVIALSDLVISFPFTSTTVEAVCAGRRGMYYDAPGKFVGAYYDRIPGFVAHGYQQLSVLVRDLLYKMDEDDYRQFLQRHIREHLDPFLDGRALSRFRALLAGQAVDDPLWPAAVES
jgi:polysaccharide biosynthesis PFTS motif protein